MTGLAILLVLLSAGAHASWNFLIKRSERPEVFTWWMAASANAVVLPVVVFLYWRDPPGAAGWGFMVATWILHLGYFVTLSRAYRDGDLSLVYPVARGAGLLLIPIGGVLVLSESISPPAVAGAGLILAGIFTLSWWGRFASVIRAPLGTLRAPGMVYALLTGLLIAVYSVVDKRGVDHVAPFVYMFAVTSSATFGLLPLIARDHPRTAFAAEWRTHRVAIVIGGLLQYAAYGLVLSAMQLSPVSYIGPFREVGLVFGVVLGAVVLKEPFGRGRTLGAGLVVAGALAVALAP